MKLEVFDYKVLGYSLKDLQTLKQIKEEEIELLNKAIKKKRKRKEKCEHDDYACKVYSFCNKAGHVHVKECRRRHEKFEKK